MTKQGRTRIVALLHALLLLPISIAFAWHVIDGTFMERLIQAVLFEAVLCFLLGTTYLCAGLVLGVCVAKSERSQRWIGLGCALTIVFFVLFRIFGLQYGQDKTKE